MRLLLLMLLICNISEAQIAEDKKLHYTAGVFTSAVTYTYVYKETKDKKKALVYSLASAILIGTLKETMDSRQKGNRFDPQDLLATTMGGITVGVTIKLFDKNVKNRKRICR